MATISPPSASARMACRNSPASSWPSARRRRWCSCLEEKIVTNTVALTAALALAAVLGCAGSANAGRAYIGTYTQEPTARGNNHGEGIYLVDVDDKNGAVSNPR